MQMAEAQSLEGNIGIRVKLLCGVCEKHCVFLQAFSIPLIQIVYETMKDQQEGKKGKATVKTGGAGV